MTLNRKTQPEEKPLASCFFKRKVFCECRIKRLKTQQSKMEKTNDVSSLAVPIRIVTIAAIKMINLLMIEFICFLLSCFFALSIKYCIRVLTEIVYHKLGEHNIKSSSGGRVFATVQRVHLSMCNLYSCARG